MTITIFVNPDCILNFLNTAKILKHLPFDNHYEFNSSDIDFTEIETYSWIRVNVGFEQYLKIKHFVEKNK